MKIRKVFIMLQYGYTFEKFHEAMQDYLVDFQINDILSNDIRKTFRLVIDDSEFEIMYIVGDMNSFVNNIGYTKALYISIELILGNIDALSFAKRICNYIGNGLILVTNNYIGNTNLDIVYKSREVKKTKINTPITMEMLRDICDGDNIKYSVLYTGLLRGFLASEYKKVDVVRICFNTDLEIPDLEKLKLKIDLGYYDKEFSYNIGNLDYDTSDNSLSLLLTYHDDSSLFIMKSMNDVRIRSWGIYNKDIIIEEIYYDENVINQRVNIEEQYYIHHK